MQNQQGSGWVAGRASEGAETCCKCAPVGKDAGCPPITEVLAKSGMSSIQPITGTQQGSEYLPSPLIYFKG